MMVYYHPEESQKNTQSRLTLPVVAGMSSQPSLTQGLRGQSARDTLKGQPRSIRDDSTNHQHCAENDPASEVMFQDSTSLDGTMDFTGAFYEEPYYHVRDDSGTSRLTLPVSTGSIIRTDKMFRTPIHVDPKKTPELFGMRNYMGMVGNNTVAGNLGINIGSSTMGRPGMFFRNDVHEAFTNIKTLRPPSFTQPIHAVRQPLRRPLNLYERVEAVDRNAEISETHNIPDSANTDSQFIASIGSKVTEKAVDSREGSMATEPETHHELQPGSVEPPYQSCLNPRPTGINTPFHAGGDPFNLINDPSGYSIGMQPSYPAGNYAVDEVQQFHQAAMSDTRGQPAAYQGDGAMNYTNSSNQFNQTANFTTDYQQGTGNYAATSRYVDAVLNDQHVRDSCTFHHNNAGPGQNLDVEGISRVSEFCPRPNSASNYNSAGSDTNDSGASSADNDRIFHPADRNDKGGSRSAANMYDVGNYRFRDFKNAMYGGSNDNYHDVSDVDFHNVREEYNVYRKYNGDRKSRSSSASSADTHHIKMLIRDVQFGNRTESTNGYIQVSRPRSGSPPWRSVRNTSKSPSWRRNSGVGSNSVKGSPARGIGVRSGSLPRVNQREYSAVKEGGKSMPAMTQSLIGNVCRSPQNPHQNRNVSPHQAVGLRRPSFLEHENQTKDAVKPPKLNLQTFCEEEVMRALEAIEYPAERRNKQEHPTYSAEAAALIDNPAEAEAFDCIDFSAERAAAGRTAAEIEGLSNTVSQLQQHRGDKNVSRGNYASMGRNSASVAGVRGNSASPLRRKESPFPFKRSASARSSLQVRVGSLTVTEKRVLSAGNRSLLNTNLSRKQQDSSRKQHVLSKSKGTNSSLGNTSPSFGLGNKSRDLGDRNLSPIGRVRSASGLGKTSSGSVCDSPPISRQHSPIRKPPSGAKSGAPTDGVSFNEPTDQKMKPIRGVNQSRGNRVMGMVRCNSADKFSATNFPVKNLTPIEYHSPQYRSRQAGRLSVTLKAQKSSSSIGSLFGLMRSDSTVSGSRKRIEQRAVPKGGENDQGRGSNVVQNCHDNVLHNKRNVREDDGDHLLVDDVEGDDDDRNVDHNIEEAASSTSLSLIGSENERENGNENERENRNENERENRNENERENRNENEIGIKMVNKNSGFQMQNELKTIQNAFLENGFGSLYGETQNNFPSSVRSTKNSNQYMSNAVIGKAFNTPGDSFSTSTRCPDGLLADKGSAANLLSTTASMQKMATNTLSNTLSSTESRARLRLFKLEIPDEMWCQYKVCLQNLWKNRPNEFYEHLEAASQTSFKSRLRKSYLTFSILMTLASLLLIVLTVVDETLERMDETLVESVERTKKGKSSTNPTRLLTNGSAGVTTAVSLLGTSSRSNGSSSPSSRRRRRQHSFLDAQVALVTTRTVQFIRQHSPRMTALTHMPSMLQLQLTEPIFELADIALDVLKHALDSYIYPMISEFQKSELDQRILQELTAAHEAKKGFLPHLLDEVTVEQVSTEVGHTLSGLMLR